MTNAKAKTETETPVEPVEVTVTPVPIDHFGDPEAMAIVQVATHEYPCSCGVIYSTSSHLAKCNVHKFTDWTEGHCEWDAIAKSYVFYENGPDGQVYLTDYSDLLLTDSEFWAIAERAKPLTTPLSKAPAAKPLPPKKLECVCNPPKQWFCDKCGVIRESPKDPWNATDKKVTNGQGSWDDDWTGYAGGSAFYQKDRHAMELVTFPNGVKVYGSSHHSRGKDEKRPTFAIYLDDMWRPDCLAYMIPWQDYGTPKIPFTQAFAAISDGYDLAVEGSVVEVGCIGGHGRTGTVIACMAILSGVKPKNAVKWVQKNYCSHAVEGAKQGWIVECFGAWLTGTTPPPKPPDPPPYVPKKDAKKNTQGTLLTQGGPAAGVTTSPMGSTVDNTTKGPFPCHLCHIPMYKAIRYYPGQSHPVTTYKCHNLACSVGAANIGKVTTATREAQLTDVVAEIDAALGTSPEKVEVVPTCILPPPFVGGDWSEEAMLNLFNAEGRDYAWPGFARIEDQYKCASEPITLQIAVERANALWEEEEHEMMMEGTWF